MGDTAKLFMSGRSQAVRLPKQYRFSGTEVRVSRDGDKVVLEPIRTIFDAAAWRAELDALGAAEFFPEGTSYDDLLPVRDIAVD